MITVARRSLFALLLTAIAGGAAEAAPPDDFAAFLKAYDAAFNAKDLERLAGFYHPDVTIFEGGSVNDGWADYRDHHLGPELKEFADLEFTHVKVVPHLLGGGRSAYVTAEYRLKAKVGDRPIDAEGLETLVLVNGSDGAWKIRHSHTSSRRKPAATP